MRRRLCGGTGSASYCRGRARPRSRGPSRAIWSAGCSHRQEATATWWHATYAPTVRTPNAVIGMDFDAAASPTAAGSVTLYDAVRPYAGASLRLAELVQRAVVASLRAEGAAVPDLGVHTDVGFGSALTQADRAYGHLLLLGPAKRGYLDTPTMAPAALIEPLFLTDPPEASVAESRAGQQAIARGLADAVARFFKR